MHNESMDNYSNNIAIIGGGIAGLALGCVLKKEGIPVIIFEKSKSISNHGAGISISKNGISILKKIDIYDVIKELSSEPKHVRFYTNSGEITSFNAEVVTTSRQTLYQALLDRFYSLKGEILFDHCLNDILFKVRNNALNLKIKAVVSNHKTAEEIANFSSIPFY